MTTEIIFLFGIYFSIGSIRVICNLLNFDKWMEFERESEAGSRMDDLILNDISKQNPKVVEGYIRTSFQREYSKRDFAIWAIAVLIVGPLNLLALPRRW